MQPCNQSTRRGLEGARCFYSPIPRRLPAYRSLSLSVTARPMADWPSWVSGPYPASRYCRVVEERLYLPEGPTYKLREIFIMRPDNLSQHGWVRSDS